MAISKNSKTGRYQSRFRDSTGRAQQFTSKIDFPSGMSKTKAQRRDIELIDKIEAELNGSRIPDLEGMLDRWLKDYAPHLSGEKKLISHANQLRPYLTGRNIEDTGMIAGQIKTDMSDLSGNTVNKRLSILKRITKLAFGEWQITDIDHGARVNMAKLPKHKVRFPSQKDVKLIAGNCRNPLVSDLIILMAHTGIRHAELKRLKEGDIWDGTITIDGKDGRTRAFKISQAAQAAAKRIEFPVTIAYRTISKYFTKAVIASGIEHTTLHDLRHAFASWLVQSGQIQAQELQALMGHSKFDMTRRYAHLAPKHLDIGADILDGKVVPIR